MAHAPPTHARNLDRAVARHGDVGRAWADGLWQGDPLADAVVADLAGAPGGGAMGVVGRALADGVESVPDAGLVARAVRAARPRAVLGRPRPARPGR